MIIKTLNAAALAAIAVACISAQTSPPSQPGADPMMRTFSFITDQQGGYLGVQTTEVTKDNFSKYGLRDVQGVAVVSVSDNSPAAAAGIMANDVILRVNGDDVTSGRKLSRLISEVAPDHNVKITVLRNGSEQEFTATIASKPQQKYDFGGFAPMQGGEMQALPVMPRIPQGQTAPPQSFKMDDLNGFFGSDGQPMMPQAFGKGVRRIGVAVYPLSKQLGEKYGVTSGVLINEVNENTPASRAGLQAGDVITAIDGKRVADNSAVVSAVNAKQEGPIEVTFIRDRQTRTVSITPEAGKDGYFLFRQGTPVAPMNAPLATPLPDVPKVPLKKLQTPGRTI